MQIRIIGASIAFGFPKSGFGLNATTFVYILLRSTPSSEIQTLAIDQHFTIGSKSGTFIWSNVKTEWSYIDSIKYPWVCDAALMTGKIIDLSIIGALFGSGKADIKMQIIDKDGEQRTLVSKMNIDSSGFQLTGLKIRGVLKLLPGLKSIRCK